MTDMKLIKRDASIVVRGSFNPAIFRPTWFVKEGIINPDDVDLTKEEYASPEIARLSLFGGTLESISNRFLVQTSDQGSFGRMRDLVLHVFTTLSHTPVTLVGINGIVEYQLKDEKTWKNFGDVLAPKRIWETFLPAPVGLMNMTIQAQRTDELKGVTHIQLAGTTNRGIRIDINNHIDLAEGGTGALLTILSESWDRLQDEILRSSETIMNETLKCIQAT